MDIEPLFWGEVFAQQRNVARFGQATVDRVGGSVFWPTGADLAPDLFYSGAETPYGSIRVGRPATVASGSPDTGQLMAAVIPHGGRVGVPARI